MIKASMLQPSLARLGKIVIGEKATGKGGSMLPRKLDHFAIKTLQRDAQGGLILDKALMGRLGERPTVLRIRLPFDDIEANFQTRLSYYRGRTLFCSGDGEEAKRLQVLQAEGKAVYGPAAPYGPCGAGCPDFVDRRCKPLGILRVILEEQQTVGGIYEFRTTSWNSIRNILSGLATVKAQTGGVLAWVPLIMRLVPQTVQPKDGGTANTAYVVQVVFDGSPQVLLEKVRDLLSLRMPLIDEIRRLEAQQKALQSAPEEPEDAADTQDEFYPELAEAEPPVEGEVDAGLHGKPEGNGRPDPAPVGPPAASGNGAQGDPKPTTASGGSATPASEPKTREALELAIRRKLHELAPGDNETAKAERRDYIRECWHKDGYGAILALNDKTLWAGWKKLRAMTRELPPAAEELDDAPAPTEEEGTVPFDDDQEASAADLWDDPLDPEAEAHLARLAEEREAARGSTEEDPPEAELIASAEQLAELQRRYDACGYGPNLPHRLKDFPPTEEGGTPVVPWRDYLDMIRVVEALEKIPPREPAAGKA